MKRIKIVSLVALVVLFCLLMTSCGSFGTRLEEFKDDVADIFNPGKDDKTDEDTDKEEEAPELAVLTIKNYAGVYSEYTLIVDVYEGGEVLTKTINGSDIYYNDNSYGYMTIDNVVVGSIVKIKTSQVFCLCDSSRISGVEIISADGCTPEDPSSCGNNMNLVVKITSQKAYICIDEA